MSETLIPYKPKVHKALIMGQAKPQKRPRTVRNKRTGGVMTYSPKEGHEYYIYQLNIQKPKERFDCAIAIEFKFYFKRPKSVSWKKRPYPSVVPDLDNLEKFMCDAMNESYYKDDSLIVYKISSKVYAGKDEEPRTEITIKEY